MTVEILTVDVMTENFLLGGHPLTIELTADQQGLTACRLLDKAIKMQTVTTNRYLRQASAELTRYFDGMLRNFEAHIAPDGTDFQRMVWQATASIPYGEVRSYAWVADQIGNPKSVRAVAQALGANPLLLYVPCHRVVRSDGTIGGFSCGLKWKNLLLAREGITVPDAPLGKHQGRTTDSASERFL